MSLLKRLGSVLPAGRSLSGLGKISGAGIASIIGATATAVGSIMAASADSSDDVAAQQIAAETQPYIEAIQTTGGAVAGAVAPQQAATIPAAPTGASGGGGNTALLIGGGLLAALLLAGRR